MTELQSDKNADMLLETIRKELNSIITDNEFGSKVPQPSSETKQKVKPQKKVRIRAGKDDAASEEVPPPPPPKADPVKVVEQFDSEVAKNAAFVERQAAETIDLDLQKMRSELQRSYELFQTIGEKFDAINFSTLKSRISHARNLRLNEKCTEQESAKLSQQATNFNASFQKSFLDNNIAELTSEMCKKFRKHPGEFGDVPELSSFFQACTQLEHGLQDLKRHRDVVGDLSNRMCWAAGVSYNRIREIQATLAKNKEKKVVE